MFSTAHIEVEDMFLSLVYPCWDVQLWEWCVSRRIHYQQKTARGCTHGDDRATYADKYDNVRCLDCRRESDRERYKRRKASKHV